MRSDAFPKSIRSRRPGLVAEDHVLLDRQVVREHEVLVHHADADGDRVARRLEALLDASDR